MGERKTEQGIRDAKNADPGQKRSAKARTVFVNRFKGLDLIDRVSDELWMEVRDIVQETGIKTIPKKKKCKKQTAV